MTMKISKLVLLVASLFTSSEGYTPTSPSKTAASSSTAKTSLALSNFDYTNQNRIPWVAEGYNSWKWGDYDINYVEMGDKSKPALLLIHGFGASAYHYRYNIPVLARDYHVYAFDMLGFGLSSKPVQDYSPEVWRDQALDFIEQVIGKTTTVVGNSLGGFTALYAASSSVAKAKDLINGCVLLNAAGRFRDPTAPMEVGEKNQIIESIVSAIKRFVIHMSFVYTKQPARIEQVLRQVYPVNDGNVDEELVESIRVPSLDPNAAEVFYRVIERNGSGPGVFVDDLLQELECPLLLCWGEEDPWIRPKAADKIQALYPASQRVSIDAGHCPHDEAPESVNSALSNFMTELAK